MSTPAPTPRTDAETYTVKRRDFHVTAGSSTHSGETYYVVRADFARTLERELSEVTARLRELEEDRKRLDWLDRNEWMGGSKLGPDMSGKDTQIKVGRARAFERGIRAAIDGAREKGTT